MLKSLIYKFQNKTEEVGWKRLPLALYKSASHRLKYFPKTFYVKNVLRNKTFANIFPFKKPIILLYGYSRSGTSWAGKILSFSPDVAYMREPITQTFIQELDYEPPFYRSQNENVNENFKKIANQSFAGIPPISDVMKDRSDFFPFTRSKRSLLIKELAPHTVSYFIKHFSLKTIILLRHPAAVADSHIRMGWLQEDDLEKFGYSYGKKMARAIKAIKGTDYTIQSYESLAHDPKKKFLELFQFMEVEIPEEFNAIIQEYCKQSKVEWNPYNTKRSSAQQALKWKQNLTKKSIETVKRGYSDSGLEYYQDDKYWNI